VPVPSKSPHTPGFVVCISSPSTEKIIVIKKKNLSWLASCFQIFRQTIFKSKIKEGLNPIPQAGGILNLCFGKVNTKKKFSPTHQFLQSYF